MAFDVSAISQWNNEIADRSQIILAPILAAKTMQTGIQKVSGITGENVKLPIFETSTPWQAGANCGFTTSGTTTLTQFTITTSPVTINEGICLNDLETKFAKQWLPAGSKHESMDILNMWIERKQAQLAKQIESALWQAKTTYTNATWLKQFNGFISVLDTAGTAVTATSQSSITASNVISIFDEIVFQKLLTIPEVLQNNPVVYCSMEDYFLLLQAFKNANYFQIVQPKVGSDVMSLSFMYPGTNVEVIAVPGLNSTNAVDTGSLPTAVKHRIVATYKENLVVGFNAENDWSDSKVWFSDDNDQLRMKLRFHLGVNVIYPARVVTYSNT